jgi:hypothetical protein
MMIKVACTHFERSKNCGAIRLLLMSRAISKSAGSGWILMDVSVLLTLCNVGKKGSMGAGRFLRLENCRETEGIWTRALYSNTRGMTSCRTNPYEKSECITFCVCPPV